MSYRKPTLQEQADAWKHLAFEINLHRTITMNHGAVVECLKRIDSWVESHGTANGERSDKDVDANVNRAFWEKIAKTPEVGLKARKS